MSNKDKSKPEKKTRPPYAPYTAMQEFFFKSRRLKPSIIDTKFLKANGIAPKNESAVVASLKFLGIIDKHNKPTQKLDLLRVEGEKFNINLREIVEESYKDVFSNLDIQIAEKEDVKNYFIVYNGLSNQMAYKSMVFLLSVCKDANIKISDDLAGALSHRKLPTKPGAEKKSIEKKKIEESTRGVGLPKTKPSREVGKKTPERPPFNLNVTIDMSNWDENKMRRFFKWSYGIFDDEDSK